jgi:hypothetical protein
MREFYHAARVAHALLRAASALMPTPRDAKPSTSYVRLGGLPATIVAAKLVHREAATGNKVLERDAPIRVPPKVLAERRQQLARPSSSSTHARAVEPRHYLGTHKTRLQLLRLSSLDLFQRGMWYGYAEAPRASPPSPTTSSRCSNSAPSPTSSTPSQSESTAASDEPSHRDNK